MTVRAVVLFSGGLDSTTVLALAQHAGRECYALTVDYGQRHRAELAAAANIARARKVAEHRVVTVDFGQFGGSSLTDPAVPVPEHQTTSPVAIPNTYVPARNTVMLALALGWAEVLQAGEIHLGVNAVDYSGYPDCRPAFIAAFEQLANLATKAGVEKTQTMRLVTPLIAWSKAEIVQAGTALNVEYAQTVSCYQAATDGAACGRCDACHFRREGFLRAGVDDPTRYRI
jgi:7-cyano-7-deazaguanine synthase